MTEQNILDLAKKVFDIESQAVLSLKDKLDPSFVKIVELIYKCKGKVIVVGVGKSGLIGKKFSATLCSTGTPSTFLHSVEAVHGDLGLVSFGDLVIAISYGGESAEISSILRFAKKRDVPTVCITGNVKGEIATQSNFVFDVKVAREACPLGLAPTSSSISTLAACDAIAMCVMKMKSFTESDFAENHPGGGLGFKLTRIRDLMRSGSDLPILPKDSPMGKVLTVMSRGETRGAAGIVNESGDLVGIITDGDIRRRLEGHSNPLEGVAGQIMTANPKTIDCSELAEKALFLLEQFPINVLFVLDKASINPRRPIGLVHVQDLVKAKLR